VAGSSTNVRLKPHTQWRIRDKCAAAREEPRVRQRYEKARASTRAALRAGRFEDGVPAPDS